MPVIQGVFDGNADGNAGELWSAGLSLLANLRLRSRHFRLGGYGISKNRVPLKKSRRAGEVPFMSN